MIFDRATFKRVVLQGHRAWREQGPKRINPYGRDPRNGAWSQGALWAKRGLSESQAWREFVRQEYNRLPTNGAKPMPEEVIKDFAYPEIVPEDFMPGKKVITYGRLH